MDREFWFLRESQSRRIYSFFIWPCQLRWEEAGYAGDDDADKSTCAEI